MTIETPAAPTPIRRRRGPNKRKATIRAPRRTASSTGLVAGLRAQLAEQVAPCPTCGSQSGNKSLMAREVGISIMSLNKFLKGGSVRSDTVDAVHAYLQRK